MDISSAKECMNKTVIAHPEHWGSYTCELLRIWENLVAPSEKYRWKGKVQIIECIESPSQKTIDGKCVCPRNPYKPGEIQDFNISEMEVSHE